MPHGKKKTVLVADHNSPILISLAEHLGGDPGDFDVLLARSPAGAVTMAKEYQPEIAILVSSFVQIDGKLSLLDLIKDVSPKTRVIIVNSLGEAAGQ